MTTFRQQEVQNPHFRLPFQFGGINGGALMNEQDAAEDVIDCIKAIIAFPIGSRHDMPDFGIPELLFKQMDKDTLDILRDAIAEWEERANIDVEGGPNISDQQILDILVKAGLTENA